MDKIAYNKMNVLDQIAYINKETETKSLAKICKDVGINRSTVQRVFEREGYKRDPITSQYAKDNTIVIQSHQSNTLVPLQSQKKAITSIPKSDAKVLLKYENDMMELIDNKADLLEMLKYYKNNANIVDIPQLNLEELPKEYKSNIINKSIKVYQPVQELFDEVCNQYSNHKKQDLISLALFQFCKTYKK